MSQYHHGNLRNNLIEAGIKMIQVDGIEKLSLRKLATLCEVSEAAPYKHFANKDQLLSAMQEYISGLLMEHLTEADLQAETNSPQAILNMGKAYVLFFLENPEYYEFLFLNSKIKIDLTMQYSLDTYPPFQYFKRRAYDVYQALGLSKERIKYGIIGMWAKVHGLAAITSMKSVTVDFNWEDVLDQILIE